MPQTRMFRDRVVSMEQTLEGGEKHLEFLKGICREAFPEFEYREHALDHERDLFLMRFEAPDGRRKTVGWTRMVLFDAERLPSLVENPVSPMKSRLLAFLQARGARSEIVVTFRHLEEGWVDTPEPRREKRRGRRGGRDGRGRGQAAAAQGRGEAQGQGRGRAAQAGGGGGGAAPGRRDEGERSRQAGRSERPVPSREARPQPGPRPPAAEAPSGTAAAGAPGEARPGGRRRRFRRRRRGRGGAPGNAPSGGPPQGGPPSAGGQP